MADDVQKGRRRRHWLGLVVAAFAVAGAIDCAEQLGACEGYSELLTKGYCYDGWTEKECRDYDQMHINGAQWYFHPQQTCADRGF